MPVDTINLNQIAPNRGVTNTNYFNGRTLAAEDLLADQAARRQQVAQLGRAVGAGVAHGLQVYPSPAAPGSVGPTTSVTVAAGLAVNRRGRPLALPADIQVALTVTTPPVPVGAGLFADCQPPQSSATVVSSGIYILTISPASDYEGAVAAVDLSGADPTLSGCGSASLIEGVAFRLVGLNLDALPGISSATLQTIKDLLGMTDIAGLSRLRNILAHIGFGTEQWLKAASNLAGSLTAQAPDDPFGLAAAARTLGWITDCDVPLALIYWTQSAIGFIDRWAVRRGLAPVRPAYGFPWAAGTAEVLGHAVFAQFQEQIEDLADLTTTTSGLAGADLSQYFDYLPPAGAIPVTGGGSPRGFASSTFFGQRGFPTKPSLREKDVIGLFRKAENLPPVVVASADMLSIYWVADNLVAAGQGPAQLYQVFITRDLHGLLGEDDVAGMFQHTWASYSALLQNMNLLPKVLTTDLLPLWNTLTTAQQQIIQYAMAREALALASALDEPSVLVSFNNLYALQKNLATLAQIPYPNDPGATDRLGKMALFVPLLDTPPAGLQPALTSGSVRAVLAAQQAINKLIDTWSGQYAVGQVLIQNHIFPTGPVLVPTQTFVFPMSVQNLTQGPITGAVSAALTNTPKGTWGNAFSIQDPVTKAVVSNISLVQGQVETLNLVVTTPADASNNGEAVTIAFNVDLPLPFPKTYTGTLDLTTGTGAGPASLYSFTIKPLLVPNLSNLQPSQTSTFEFETAFVSGGQFKSVSQCTFSALFTFTGTTPTSWGLAFLRHQEATLQNNTLTYTINHPLSADPTSPSVERTTMTVKTPSARTNTNQTCSVTIKVNANVPDPQGSVPATGQVGPFVLTLKSS